jgi:NADPH-dependent 2,4-dienoyl-CoA reductase/sulfur reductase-like enzyme/rhodanese-related sulfurtransferase
MTNINHPKILVVGGVAGGASCAARLRRLSEEAKIIIFERGHHVSFASCGLPYYVGEVISREKDLLVATPELFRRRFNIQVRLRHEVVSIDPAGQTISVKDLENGREYREDYTSLVLAPGTVPLIPPVPGLDSPGVFTLRTIDDSNRLKAWISEKKVKKAAIIGAGFIGMEAAENLTRLGISVSIFEMLPQVMPPLDPEIAATLQEVLLAHDVQLYLADGVARLDSSQAAISLRTRSGADLAFDMVLLAAGVKPEIALARSAGLQIGQLGGIRVDQRMQTSNKHIWAVGDAVEVRNFVTGEWNLVALGGPASREGRIAADAIMGRDSHFRGSQATSVCQVFDTIVAATGVSEKSLLALAKSGHIIPYEKVYLHPGNHAGYYPGARTMTIKLIFSPKDGKILGAQAVGGEGVEKRIDVISMAIQKDATVLDLEEAELCYAPQFGSTKDPVNLAGMVASNALRGDSPLIHWDQALKSGDFILDVRDPLEYESGHAEGAINIPLPTLRDHLRDLPSGKEIAVCCAAGQRSYYATRILKMNGFTVKNISGGMTSFRSRPKT